jgi:hypothetical protein
LSTAAKEPAQSLDRGIELLKERSYNEALPIIKKFATNGNADGGRY